MNKIILFIATSQDGFIADKNGGVDWLPQPQSGVELETAGYTPLMERTDTILMGSKSFKQILTFGKWAWPDKHTYVFSSQALQSPLSCITITTNTPLHLMQKIRERKLAKDIWLLGGAAVAQSFAKENLIDEIILTTVPQSLGKGIPLGLPLHAFNLKEEKDLMNNMIQRTYLRNFNSHDPGLKFKA